MPEDIKAKRENFRVNDYTSQEYIGQALKNIQQFVEPTDYVTILQAK